MAEADQQGVPAYHSEEDILSHPRFPIARDEFVNAILALYEYDPFLNRLLLEAGRNVLFVVITASYAQVTEKLYARSRFRYRHYRKHLEPAIPILRPVIERLGYTID